MREMRAQLEVFIRRHGDLVLASALTAVALIQSLGGGWTAPADPKVSR